MIRAHETRKIVRISDGERKVRAITETPKEKWGRCVRECKLLVMSRNLSRMKICNLTLEACDIKLGGGGHWDGFKNQYHVGKFAENIKINSKTLRNWMLVYRYVFTKLPKAEQEAFKWNAGEKVRATNKTRDMTPNQIKKAYLEILNISPQQKHQNTMTKYLSHLKSGIDKLSPQEKAQLKEDLEGLLQLL